MGEKVKEFSGKATEMLKKVPKKIWIIAGVAVAVIIAAAVIISSNKPYTVLFTELSNDDLSRVQSYLEEQGVKDYRIESNNTILVPSGQEAQLKMKVLMEERPTTGFGYSSYYDNVSALSTESERNRAYILLMNDRLSAVVRCFDGVRDAVVTISEGEDRRYVLDSDNAVEAKASVWFDMRDGKTLTMEQADAIRYIVSHSVKGLNVDSVTITDSAGNTYSGTGTPDMTDSTALKLQLQEQYSNRIRTQVVQVVAPFVGGSENVKVSVDCEVDIDATTKDRTEYFLPEWAADGSTEGEGIVTAKMWDYLLTRDNDEAAGGVVGTTTNSDLNDYFENGVTINGNERTISSSGQVEYGNTKEETHTEGAGGRIINRMVAVSINSDASGALNLDNLRSHIARAAGISEQDAATSISIYAAPFPRDNQGGSTQTPAETAPMWALYAALIGLILFFILLAIILYVIKRRRKKKLEKQLALQEEMRAKSAEELLASIARSQQAAEPVGADVMELKTEKSMELRKDIRKFADENPEIAAQMIRTMLRGGDKDG